MTLNHDRIRQVLHIITIIAFSISIFFQLRNLYLYGGKPPKKLEGNGEDNDNDNDEYDEEGFDLKSPAVEDVSTMKNGDL